MIAYRIADARHPIYDSTGAMLCGGRWNSIGQRVIYAAETYAGAILEVLVHANLAVPPRHHQAVRINIPDEVLLEAVSDLPGWDDESGRAARTFGDVWLKEGRSAVLRVPSIVTEGREYNVLINPLHRQAALIHAMEPEPRPMGRSAVSISFSSMRSNSHEFEPARFRSGCRRMEIFAIV